MIEVDDLKRRVFKLESIVQYLVDKVGTKSVFLVSLRKGGEWNRPMAIFATTELAQQYADQCTRTMVHNHMTYVEVTEVPIHEYYYLGGEDGIIN